MVATRDIAGGIADWHDNLVNGVMVQNLLMEIVA